MRTFVDLFRDLNHFSVGFEPTLALLDQVNTAHYNSSNYPPYDLEKIDDSNYRITIALAGFSAKDLTITLQNSILTISGIVQKASNNTKSTFIHKGIGGRGFTREFVLDKNVNVVKSDFKDGLLTVDLVYEMPDHMKIRNISINSDSSD